MSTTTRAVARPLKVLVPLIQQELINGQKAAEQASMPYFTRAGEMLLEAKTQVAHGEWMGWVKRNFSMSHTTAWSYMKLARAQIFTGLKFETISQVTRPDRAESDKHQPVREAVERVSVEKMRQERRTREKEARLMRQLALQVIDAGYKVVAMRVHPDKGGSSETMVCLNRVRDLLKRNIMTKEGLTDGATRAGWSRMKMGFADFLRFVAVYFNTTRFGLHVRFLRERQGRSEAGRAACSSS